MKNKLREKLLIFKDEGINLKSTICILLLVMVISAFFGFVYEMFFYRIDLGYFVKRGSTYGPWIPIYAFGGLFITFFTYRFRKNPIIVFIINCLITGALEYLTGLVFWECFHKRLWDYNVEIWNFGNINGYICLRSIIIKKLAVKISEKKLAIVSYTLSGLFFFDVIMYMILN